MKKKSLIKKKVVKSTSGEKETLLDTSLDTDTETTITTDKSNFGMSKGMTLNMGEYQSLRVDVWCDDKLRPKESLKDGVCRLDEEITDILAEIVEDTIDA